MKSRTLETITAIAAATVLAFIVLLIVTHFFASRGAP